MSSNYVLIPLLVFCTPLAILTSSLALFVVSIRLGFLAIEFSGGFVLDFIKWGINEIIPDEKLLNNKKNVKMDIKDTIHKPKKHHHIKQSSPSKSSMNSLLETKSTKFYSPKGSGNNFVSSDDYFMVSMIANAKRPSGRRARSDRDLFYEKARSDLFYEKRQFYY